MTLGLKLEYKKYKMILEAAWVFFYIPKID